MKHRQNSVSQIDIFDEIIVDNFAGGGVRWRYERIT